MNVDSENTTIVGKERDLCSRIIVVSVKRVLSNLDRFLGIGHRDIRNYNKRVLGSHQGVSGVGGIGGAGGVGSVGS
jgi:hypothetical protein